MGWKYFLISAAIWFVGGLLVNISMTRTYNVTLYNLHTIFTVFGFVLFIWGCILLLRWLSPSPKSSDPNASINERGHSAAKAFLQINPISLAIIAVAGLLIGFFLLDGYHPYLGILGSIPRMDISIGDFAIPYKWIVIVCLSILFYAIWRAVRQHQQQA